MRTGTPRNKTRGFGSLSLWSISGQRFAVMEEKVLLARLVRQFRFRATMTFQENRGLPELVLRPSRGVPLIVERRLE